MAVQLNKNRMKESWLVFALCILLVFITKPIDNETSITHKILDISGFVMVLICAFGRIYTTAFLGGHKNETIIKDGPFSVVRNPLYVFSFIGMLGVSVFTQRPWIMLVATLGMAVIYYSMVKREEKFLLQKFGNEYAEYCRNVPRFIPNPGKFRMPKTIEVSPARLLSAVFDTIWWFAILGILEFIERYGL